MIQRILASTAVLALTAGAASADMYVYGGGPYVARAPMVVERHAAPLPHAPMAIYEPAPYLLVVPEVDRLAPGAPTGSGPNDEKRTVGDEYRATFDRAPFILR